jgi:hypothetical protein
MAGFAKIPGMKLLLIALTFLLLASAIGCERDVREPGEPRIILSLPR